MLRKTLAANGASVFPDWTGECVALIASGASAKGAPIEMLRDRIRVFAVNNAVDLAPWADVLYSCDWPWWQFRRGAPDFKGLKLSQDCLTIDHFKEVVKIDVAPSDDVILIDKLGKVGSGGNGGFQALNLCVQFGVVGVALVGFDMVGEHWHGRHLPPLTNPDESNFQRWRKAFDGAHARLAELGVDVVNCSTISTIRAYPRMTIPEALERWGL